MKYNQAILSILFSMFLCLSSVVHAEQIQIQNYLYNYEDCSRRAYADIYLEIPSEYQQTSKGQLLTQSKEFKLKDEQGRDIIITISPFFYRDNNNLVRITLNGLQVDSSFFWEVPLSFAPAKEIAKEFSLQQDSQSIKFEGIEFNYRHLSLTNEIGANFKLTLLRGEHLKDLYFLKGDSKVAIEPIDIAKGGTGSRTFYFRLPERLDMSLGIVTEVAESRPTFTIKLKIVGNNSKQNIPKNELIKDFQLLSLMDMGEFTIISLKPNILDEIPSYRIKRNAQYLALFNAQNAPIKARFGIFREKYNGELLTLGFEQTLNTPYLQANSKITLTSERKEKELDFKGIIPLPPHITIQIK